MCRFDSQYPSALVGVAFPFRGSGCSDGTPVVRGVSSVSVVRRGDPRGEEREENSVVEGEGEDPQPKKLASLEEPGDLGRGLSREGV